MASTPDMVEKFKTARASMIPDPSFVNGSIAKLSPAAQVHAKAMFDIVKNEYDLTVGRAKIAALRAPLPPAILKELDDHSGRIAEKYGLPKCE